MTEQPTSDALLEKIKERQWNHGKFPAVYVDDVVQRVAKIVKDELMNYENDEEDDLPTMIAKAALAAIPDHFVDLNKMVKPAPADEAVEALKMVEDGLRFIAEMHGRVKDYDAAQFKKCSADIAQRCKHLLNSVADILAALNQQKGE